MYEQANSLYKQEVNLIFGGRKTNYKKSSKKIF